MIYRLINFLLIQFLKIVDKFYENKSYIFMFHDIVLDANIENNVFKLQLTNFNKFIDSLKLNNYESSDLENILKSKNQKLFHFTFDDANESVYSSAYPILIENKIYFTIFINVEYIDKPGYLTSVQIAELSKCEYCKIGSHGMLHNYFRRLTKSEVLSSFQNSKFILEKLINQSVEYFAFPYGSLYACSFENISLAKESNIFKACFSTIPVSLSIKKITSVYFLPRVNVTDFSFYSIVDDKSIS